MRGGSNLSDADLLRLLSEELKQPLINISQLSEIDGSSNEISIEAKKALRTLDNVILYKRFSSGQQSLDLEPVHIGSTIHDVSMELQPLMKSVSCHADIRIQKSLQLVDADRELLHAVIVSVWQAMLGTITSPADIVCAAKKTSDGVRVSITSTKSDLEDFSLIKANTKSSQPFKSLSGPSTDLLNASNMLGIFGYRLSKIVSKERSGFGVTLKASQQLQIV